MRRYSTQSAKHVKTVVSAIYTHAQQEGWNIRVDLLFTWPLLFAISIGAAWLEMRSIFTTNAKSQPDDDSQDPFPVDTHR